MPKGREQVKGARCRFEMYTAIDLGTSTVKIYDLKKDTITKEKNMIAIRNREQVIAVGNYAYEMHERTPSNIEVITPMSNGRIANVLMVEAVLHTLLHRCTRHMGYRPELYFSVSLRYDRD